MTFIINNLIYSRIVSLDYTNPITYIDLFVAIFLSVACLLYIRRFPSFRVILGTIFLLSCSIIFYISGFVFTSIVFGLVSTWVLIALPLIFSAEIRHYLGKIGRFPFLSPKAFFASHRYDKLVRNIVDTCYELAERNVGGTIVIARKTGLGQTIETGVILDAKFSSKLIQSIFFPKSPLHDGAVLVQGERIIAAGCLLPVSGEVKLDPPFGTRHRSGIAITKDTDAVVLIISEQRGEVSLAENGKLEVNLDRANLTEMLHKLL